MKSLRFAARPTFFAALAACLLLAGFATDSWAAGSRKYHRCKTYKISGKKLTVCNGINGKQGPGGPGGPGGPAGPAGPGGPGGPGGAPGNRSFGGELRAGTGATTLFNQNGTLLEGACAPGGATTLDVRPEGAEGNHNSVLSTTFTEGGVFFEGGASKAGNERVPILEGYTGRASGLIGVRTAAGAITTVQWFATPSSLGDCIVGGTASY